MPLDPFHTARDSLLPETAPSNIMLTQVLQVRSLFDEPVDLIVAVKLLSRSEVFARELLLDTTKDLKRPCILNFLRLYIVGRGWGDTGAMTGPADHGGEFSGVGTHDGLPALGRVVGFWG